MHTGDRYQPGPGMLIGGGGDATAVGGKAGHGGDCCNAGGTGTGGNGGKGGNAQANGGAGAEWLFWPNLGPGGDASAIGGNGGFGGRGVVAGGAGGAEGSASAHGGAGHPPGKWVNLPGAPGQPGGPCGAPPAKYGTFVSYSDAPWLVGIPNLYDTASQQIRSQEVSDPFTLGGNANTLLAPLGRSVILKGDNSALWAANEYGGIGMYSNPLTGGDRAPDRVLDVQSTPWNAIWYEEARDILYATSMITGLIYAWDGASTGDPGRDPDRTIQIADYFGGAYLTGAPGSDRLFVSVRIGGVSKILVYDNAHTASGAQAPGRVIVPTGGFQRHTLAWDACQDRLYFSQPPKGQTIGVINSASTREGSVDPDRTFSVSFGGMAADDWISALAVACAHDVLFVGMYGGAATTGSVLVYPSASTLEATPAPAARQSPDHAVLGLGVFKQ